MNKLPLIAAFVAALGGAGWYLTSPDQGALPGGTAFSVEAQEATDVNTSGIVEMMIGNPDAAVTVTEYASFTCPHCKNFHAGPFKELKANYIDTGLINFVYREVYFDRFGLWAGMVARCGGEDRYFGLIDLIYEQQGEWTNGEPAQIADNLRRIGRTAGLSDEQLDACLADGDKAEALVALYQQNAEADQITSTPSFVINGQKYGNMNYADFSQLIDEKLED